MEKESDSQLMTKVVKGQHTALGELYARHSLRVQYAVVRWLPSESAPEAEDLVQEVFMTLWNTAHKYEETGRFRAWLYTIAYRQAQVWRRTQRDRKKKMELHKQTVTATIGPAVQTPHDVRSEMRGMVKNILEQLPSELSEVLLLTIVEGFTSSEVSQITGVARATARTRLHRARREVLALMDTAQRKEILQGGAV